MLWPVVKALLGHYRRYPLQICLVWLGLTLGVSLTGLKSKRYCNKYRSMGSAFGTRQRRVRTKHEKNYHKRPDEMEAGRSQICYINRL